MVVRVFIVRDDLKRLKVEAEKLNVRPSSLLSYILEEHHMFVSPENAGLFIELNDLPRESLTSIQISEGAYHAVRDMCVLCKLRIHTVVTAVLRDVIPSLRDFPELFPGLPVIQEMSRRREAHKRSPAIGLNQDVYDAVVQRIKENDDGQDVRESENVRLYVNAVLDALPTQDFCDAIRRMKEEGHLFSDMFSASAKQHGIRVSLDVYGLLKELSDEVDIPLSRLLSFIVARELFDTQKLKEAWEEFRLPNDVRRQWGTALKEIASAGKNRRKHD